MLLKRPILALLLSGGLTSAGLADQSVRTMNSGNLVLDGIPEIPSDIATDLERYQNTRSARFLGWLPDGSGMLISTRFGDTSQVHRVNQPMGARTQLTFFSEPVMSASIRPGEKKSPNFLFLKDEGGNENLQIFDFDITTGNATMLSDGKHRFGGLLWSDSGKFYLFSANDRNGRDTDVYYSEPGGKNTRRLTEMEGTFGSVAIDRQEERVLIRRFISANAGEYHLLDLKSGEMSRLFPKEEGAQIAYGSATFSADGRRLFYVSDEGREFLTLRAYDFRTEKEELITGDIPWNVERITLSPDGRQLAFSVNDDGISSLYLHDTRRGRTQQVSAVPTGLIYGLEFRPDSRALAIVLETAQTPGDVFVYDLRRRNLERWTESETGGLSTAGFVTPDLVHYPSFDELDDGKPRKIPAFYYSPKEESSQPRPVVVFIHGGPEAQFRPTFSPLIQYIVNEFGAAVLAPNVRGSSGYGKTYLTLDNWKLREDSVRDIGTLLDWIAKQPELDENRVMVYGGSYGGYMVLASLFHFNDRLAGGINVVGISNFVTFLENTMDYRRDLRRVEYGDERIPEMREFLMSISPTENAHKINRPLFVAQGLNDPRVPASEAEQIVTRVRENGGQVWYLLAKDEGHGFRRKVNRDVFQQVMLMFIQKHLVSDNGKTASN